MSQPTPDQEPPPAATSTVGFEADVNRVRSAFDRGDYAETRRRAHDLLAHSGVTKLSPEERVELERAIEGTQTDRASIVMMVVCVLLFALVAITYF